MRHFLSGNNIMVDIETMGKGSNAAVVAIGAAKFDECEVWDKFYVNVDLQSSLDAGLEVDGSTIYWWMEQSDEARANLKGDLLALDEALFMLADWMNKRVQDFGEPVIWGNGPSFDNAKLDNAYKKCKMELPWNYTNDRCYRTIKAQRPDIKIQAKGVKHNALDDAVNQAEHLIEIVSREPLAVSRGVSTEERQEKSALWRAEHLNKRW